MNFNKATAKMGTHGFTAGACAPSQKTGAWPGRRTFSVGIFRWNATPCGSSPVKKTAALVRVSGSIMAPEAVYEKARAIVTELDAGTYSGPWRVQA